MTIENKKPMIELSDLSKLVKRKISDAKGIDARYPSSERVDLAAKRDADDFDQEDFHNQYSAYLRSYSYKRDKVIG